MGNQCLGWCLDFRHFDLVVFWFSWSEDHFNRLQLRSHTISMLDLLADCAWCRCVELCMVLTWPQHETHCSSLRCSDRKINDDSLISSPLYPLPPVALKKCWFEPRELSTKPISLFFFIFLLFYSLGWVFIHSSLGHVHMYTVCVWVWISTHVSDYV